MTRRPTDRPKAQAESRAEILRALDALGTDELRLLLSGLGHVSQGRRVVLFPAGTSFEIEVRIRERAV